MKTVVLALFSLALLSSFTFNRITHEAMTKVNGRNGQAIHRIQLCQFTDIVPVKVVERLREIGGVTPVKSKEGSIYLTAPYDNEQMAAQDLLKFQQFGFKEALQVVEVNDQLISIWQYHKHYDRQGNPKDNGKPSVVRIWK
jgi:hypothetical protein